LIRRKEADLGRSVVSKDGEGERLWFGGGLVRVRVTCADTNGSFSLIEDRVPRGKTTPLHAHPHHEETFYIIDGELLFHLDGRETSCGPGSVVSVARGIPHAFLVTSEHATFLTVFTPGDVAEAFLREGGDTPTSADAEPPPLDIPRVVAAGVKTGGMQMLGPPPFKQLAVAHRTT
jgi:quercetin dioxygenase-like cupin family protein